MKLEQKLKKIASSEQEELLEELEEFEVQMQRNRVSTWKLWSLAKIPSKVLLKKLVFLPLLA